ncbi:MAG: sulfotransferase [Woeseiaceae bacterium]|nr:sulfotransferase [Gammaproteobacteria bacterium]NNK24824.1 sulfotransferase [Woeseiaceae bacterium]
MSQRPRLLYILAPSYSGSTLLTYLLAQHPAIATIGELKATRMGNIDAYRCSCGELIRECDFWSELTQRARDAGLEFSVDAFGTVYGDGGRFVDRIVRALVRGPLFETLRAAALGVLPERTTRIAAVTRQNLVLSRLVCDMQGGRVFLDGSKDSARLLHYQRSGEWDIKVIHLQRDGRGVTNSYVKHDRVDYDGAIAYWMKAVTELQRMRARLDDDMVYDLLYEDLCRDPEKELAAICDWLGIDELDHARSFDAESQHVLGNRMRLDNVSEIRLDEKWRKLLSPDKLAAFEDRAGELNRSLGYTAA